MTVPSQSFKDHTTFEEEVAIARHRYEMNAPVKQVYREILKLVKRLPPASRGYYTQYARENFVTYSEVQDQATVWSLLERAHHHSCWILNKYGVDVAAANKLKEICLADRVPAPA